MTTILYKLDTPLNCILHSDFIMHYADEHNKHKHLSKIVSKLFNKWMVYFGVLMIYNPNWAMLFINTLPKVLIDVYFQNKYVENNKAITIQ